MTNDSFRNGDYFQLEQQSKNPVYRNNNTLVHKLILNKFPDLCFDRLSIGEHENDNYRQSKYDNVDACRYSDTSQSDGTRYSDPWHWEAPYQIGDTSNLKKQSNKNQKIATISRHRVRENQNILSE